MGLSSLSEITLSTSVILKISTTDPIHRILLQSQNDRVLSSRPMGLIVINITNEQVKIPHYETLKHQLAYHFSLRDIVTNPVDR